MADTTSASIGHKKELVGVVVSDKMQKTIVVRVHRRKRHPLFGKVMKQAKKFKVHDEKNEAKIGDTVRISETRPLSREKRWRLVEIVARGAMKPAAEIQEAERLIAESEAASAGSHPAHAEPPAQPAEKDSGTK